MLNEPTVEKLQAMRLHGLLQAWQQQQTQPDINQLGFDERLGLLVDAEWLSRENRRLTRVLQQAKLKLAQACVEGIDYPVKRQLDRAVVRQIATTLASPRFG